MKLYIFLKLLPKKMPSNLLFHQKGSLVAQSIVTWGCQREKYPSISSQNIQKCEIHVFCIFIWDAHMTILLKTFEIVMLQDFKFLQYLCLFTHMQGTHTPWLLEVIILGSLIGQLLVVSDVTSQREGSRLKSRLRPFCVEFACSPCACVGSLIVNWLS